jgi:hypothetical protein
MHPLQAPVVLDHRDGDQAGQPDHLEGMLRHRHDRLGRQPGAQHRRASE